MVNSNLYPPIKFINNYLHLKLFIIEYNYYYEIFYKLWWNAEVESHVWHIISTMEWYNTEQGRIVSENN